MGLVSLRLLRRVLEFGIVSMTNFRTGTVRAQVLRTSVPTGPETGFSGKRRVERVIPYAASKGRERQSYGVIMSIASLPLRRYTPKSRLSVV
jgi:hypothetical protein